MCFFYTQFIHLDIPESFVLCCHCDSKDIYNVYHTRLCFLYILKLNDLFKDERDHEIANSYQIHSYHRNTRGNGQASLSRYRFQLSCNLEIVAMLNECNAALATTCISPTY